MESGANPALAVICLCAEWCGTCRDYRLGFEGLRKEFPTVTFRWVDIEDQADAIGDLDVENFPTLLIARSDVILFFGTMLPHLGHLRRAVETFLAQPEAESLIYVSSSPERKAWQNDADLRNLAATRDESEIG